MKLNYCFIYIIVALAIFSSCNEEFVPAQINGQWDIDLYEIVDCSDTTENVFLDLSIDSCYQADSVTEICVQSHFYTFDSIGVGSVYTYELNRTINGVEDSYTERGNYTIENLNRLVLCKPECDSVFVIRNENTLEIVDQDTLSGCNTLFRGNKNI